MGHQYFNVPIFFIVFRETIEAAIIVSVLLSFVEQLMLTGKLSSSIPSIDDVNAGPDDITNRRRNLIKRMRIQIWAGTATGFLLALAIGAAFIAVFYTKLNDLWAKTEQIWEGIFSIIAAIIIYIMGIAFLKMDKSRIKWRLKLAAAFDKSQAKMQASAEETEKDKREARSGKWALFILPFITVLREGLEAVVFVGGVSLNVEAVSIPIAVIVGIIAGLVVGYAIYRTGSTATLHWFLVGSTSFLFLIGAGLFSKGIGYFQYYRFAQGVGGDVAETGDGPGSFQVAGNVWHLTYGNPETGSPTTNGGWQIFNAIFGWNNTATIGSILGYVFYWIVIMVTLIYLRWKEGRTTFKYPTKENGKLTWAAKESAAARRRIAGKGLERRVSDNSGSDDKHAKTEPETPGLNGVPHLNETH
ncbi:uncharacterized protein I303_102311 [Kwoniella dejecticola CBS 10117]|uniref:High-affinity iron permease CaFTR1 n=1 Tax=Kwoniella dejecticola CBS 10117 TaxID=1296121 RepID=A0A1A6ABA6_9TREE|nr:high-affinity iron permease CaFTR1 [Kwoniella dejecticola CBS 10117]OBR87346.1 high-affinity iron permease CaFTR1 [Kwoniella dejecticola CBS 10117]